MKLFKQTTIAIAVVSLFTATSCNNYLDVNTDPNNIALDQVTPNFMFPVGVTNSYAKQSTSLLKISSVFTNSIAGNSIGYANPWVDEYTPNVGNNFYNDVWDGLFRGTANFDKIINYPDSVGTYIKYKGMAKVMKAYYIQILTDLYGDMPYTEAFKGQNNLTPKYDKSEDIYKASIADLESAISDFNSGIGSDPGNTDIVFGGNATKWVAFANTIKLRYLLRMSNVTGDMATYRDQKLATLSGASFVTADVTENPGYNASTDAQQNPFANYFLLTPAGTPGAHYAETVASEHAAICLNGNNTGDTRPYYQKYNGIADGRRGRIYTLVSGNVVGIRQGAVPGQPGMPAGLTVSRFGNGIRVGTGSPTTNAQLIAMSSVKSGILMTLAESKFLQAEAAVRYPSLFSNAQANFNAGITASYVTLGATTAAAQTYITQIASKPGLGFTGSTDNQIEAIMTQKWIALIGINPEQSYFDYTRTGYPASPLPTNAAKPRPNRLMYPLSEYVANASNIPAISNTDVFTKNQYTPFWARN